MFVKPVSLPNARVQAIEDYRFSDHIKTESEAIRRLIAAGRAAADTEKLPSEGT